MKTYEETFELLRKASQTILKTDNQTLLEAYTHKLMIEYIGNEEYARKSFRASVEHCKLEHKGYKTNGTTPYLDIFASNIWCQRIKENLPI